ncbi:hypothetical protein SUGI_0558050 [Cryptomeria japonica]|nr:hypothetical protein SUGI_0558050 [Cryptomeria japonica]
MAIVLNGQFFSTLQYIFRPALKEIAVCTTQSARRTARMRLEGKIAVITGGASRIREAAVRVFIENGATVVIADVQIVGIMKSAAAALAPYGIQANCVSPMVVEGLQGSIPGFDKEAAPLKNFFENLAHRANKEVGGGQWGSSSGLSMWITLKRIMYLEELFLN